MGGDGRIGSFRHRVGGRRGFCLPQNRFELNLKGNTVRFFLWRRPHWQSKADIRRVVHLSRQEAEGLTNSIASRQAEELWEEKGVRRWTWWASRLRTCRGWGREGHRPVALLSEVAQEEHEYFPQEAFLIDLFSLLIVLSFLLSHSLSNEFYKMWSLSLSECMCTCVRMRMCVCVVWVWTCMSPGTHVAIRRQLSEVISLFLPCHELLGSSPVFASHPVVGLLVKDASQHSQLLAHFEAQMQVASLSQQVLL